MLRKWDYPAEFGAEHARRDNVDNRNDIRLAQLVP